MAEPPRLSMKQVGSGKQKSHCDFFGLGSGLWAIAAVSSSVPSRDHARQDNHETQSASIRGSSLAGSFPFFRESPPPPSLPPRELFKLKSCRLAAYIHRQHADGGVWSLEISLAGCGRWAIRLPFGDTRHAHHSHHSMGLVPVHEAPSKKVTVTDLLQRLKPKFCLWHKNVLETENVAARIELLIQQGGVQCRKQRNNKIRISGYHLKLAGISRFMIWPQDA